MVRSSDIEEGRLLKKLKPAVEAGAKGDYHRAVQLLRKLIPETDAPAEALLLLGRSFHALKDYSRALAAFQDYIRQKPNSADGYLFFGRSCLAGAMPYKAVRYLRNALEKSPGNSTAMALLGIAYLKSKNSGLAVEMLQAAVEAAPTNKRIYRAYLNALMVRGIRLCGNEDYEMGFQILNFVLLNAPETGMSLSPILRLELGRAARETGRMEEALKHFTEALRISGDGNINKGDRRIRWCRASVLMALGKKTEAMKEIEKIRSHDANVPDLPWNTELIDFFLIQSFLEAGKWREAAASCRNWLKHREPQPIIHVFYAEALRNMQKFQAAQNHLKLALKEVPNELEYWYASILVCWEAEDYESLKKALIAAKNLGGDEDLIKRFSVLHQARTTKDVPALISILQNAIRTLGPEPEIMYSLGEAYLKIGLCEEALGWFEKTIALKDMNEKAYIGEITALETMLTSDKKELIISKLGALYMAYLARWPDNSSIRRDRAMFLVKTFNFAEAAVELEKLLAWQPSNMSLRRVLAYVYRKTGRYREAALFLKILLKEKPRDMALLIEYSHCLDRAGAGLYALTILQKAKEFFKPHVDLYLALGILSYRQKRIEEAMEYLKEALGLNPSDPRPGGWMAIIQKKNKEKQKKSRPGNN